MTSLLLITSIIIASLIFIFALEILFSLIPRREENLEQVTRPTLAVLIPAHNEERDIKSVICNIKKQLTENDRVVVVADNCIDETASIARKQDAEVLSRQDLSKLGKGYALDYGVRHLKSDPPQVVIIIDADCQVDDGALDLLSKAAFINNCPVQSLYLMNYIKPNVKQRIAEFAWLVKNYVRPKGLSSIKMPCQLMGTGMAFPWNIISQANLATNNIVEDMKMGLDMALAGYTPKFCPNARVTSIFPDKPSAEKTQRTRWEHGHLSILLTVIPKYIINALKKRSVPMLVMSLDILIPPLTLLFLLSCGVLLGTSILLIATGTFAPFLISLVSNIVFFISILISWYVWGRNIVSITDFLKIPLYIFTKIPLYISFMLSREKEWIKTDRD